MLEGGVEAPKYRIFYWDNRDEWIYGHKLQVESICFRKAHLPNTKETNKARWALAQGATSEDY